MFILYFIIYINSQMETHKIEYFLDNVEIDNYSVLELPDNCFLTIRQVKDNYLSYDIIDPKKYDNQFRFEVVNVKIGFVKQMKINGVWKPSLADVN